MPYRIVRDSPPITVEQLDDAVFQGHVQLTLIQVSPMLQQYTVLRAFHMLDRTGHLRHFLSGEVFQAIWFDEAPQTSSLAARLDQALTPIQEALISLILHNPDQFNVDLGPHDKFTVILKVEQPMSCVLEEILIESNGRPLATPRTVLRSRYEILRDPHSLV